MSRGGYREGAGRKFKWKSGKTKAIRVPEALANEILDYARKLDGGNQQSAQEIQPLEELKIIDLQGVPLKAIDGEMGVKLSDLVKKGYKLTPSRLQKIVMNALKFQKKWN